MGNHSSRRSQPSLTGLLRSGPTQEDFKAYVDDLQELQTFLNEKFITGHLRSSVRDDELDAEYLNALKIKLEQLQNVRRHVGHLPITLRRLLDALEPQCQRAIHELTRLQEQALTAPSQVQPVVPRATDDEDVRQAVETSTASGGKLL